MAVEGQLKDISLPSVVQMVCLERRTAELAVSRWGEKGVIYVDKGDIVHARLGSLVGEKALYHLLTWADGEFRISDHVTVLARTIAVSWDHLLMEGMRRIDEHAELQRSTGSFEELSQAGLSDADV